MNASTQLTDADWLKVQADMNNFLDELREAHGVVEENDEFVLLSDGTGHELSEFAKANGVDRSALSKRMHKEARARHNAGSEDPWAVVDPVIVYKHV